MKYSRTITGFVIAVSVTTVLAWKGTSPVIGVDVAAREAAKIRGGDCGNYQQVANAACNNTGNDSCTGPASNCIGACPFECSPTSSYGGSNGTFSGSLIPGSYCDTTTQGTCTETTCSVMGGSVPCCQCLGSSDINCGPVPFAVNAQGCSS
jgi:hypothetical protein